MVSLGQHNGCWDSTELPRAVRFSELLKQFSWRLLHSSTLLVSCFSVSSSFFSTVGNFRVLIYLLDYNFLILGSYQTRSVPNWNWRKEKKNNSISFMAATAHFWQTRPPQRRSHHRHASSATASFYSAKFRQDTGLVGLASCGVLNLQLHIAVKRFK